MRITTGAAIPRSQPGTRRARISRQVKQQRRGYAQAVLRALARSQRGRPTAQVQRVLRESLSALGVRLSPAALHDLAADIAAGWAVKLPDHHASWRLVVQVGGAVMRPSGAWSVGGEACRFVEFSRGKDYYP